ncbi:hypothetical protein GPJ56_008123 [Histomonas meleagridis]|uniref:uncharacterized protein n=1 Tax=Histomonas meleagridis TaxID=135588 RepID=UPI00355AB5FD|nr:hypothetical protein GPJ56_008123 [Histomonas meleagridis]KAH0802036.1 hypothetical protein GO595_005117 [Histomonas meleagridis]
MIRALVGNEITFTNPLAPEFLNLAIKFKDSKYVEKSVRNFQKLFVGLRTKVENGYFVKTSEAPVLKLPSYIQDCQSACDWITNNHLPKIHKNMATLAANDHITVISSSHSLSDGGYCIRAMEHSLDDDIHVTGFPMSIATAFSRELSSAEKNKPNPFPYKSCSHFIKNPFDPHLAPKGIKSINILDTISANELKCYDSIKKRPKNLTETLMAALSISFNAYGDRPNSPLGLPVIIDLRRFTKSHVDWRYGNCVAHPNMGITQHSNSTLNEILKMFKDEIKRNQTDGIFYAVNHNPYPGEPYHIYCSLSNIGPIKVKSPIIDFYIHSQSDESKEFHLNGAASGSSFCLISFSKVFDNRNIIYNQWRYQPALMNRKAFEVLRNSVTYFMKNIPMDAKFNDVYKEIKGYQEKVEREF